MRDQENANRQWTEFRMNVPWGHISGKWWGRHDVRPILAIHGWQDNSGTFDTLIPLLPKHLSYLAIDLPGHGFSSHFPAGVMYHKIDYVNVILRIVEAMKWDKVSLIAHSMGGYAAIWFAAMYPQKMDLLVLFDALKAPDSAKESFWSNYAVLIKGSVAIEERNQRDDEPPSYGYEDCLERYFDGVKRYSYIDKDKCSHILARSLKESIKNPGKFYFSRDPRLRTLDDGIFPLDHYETLAERIRIPVIMFNAQQLPPFDKDQFVGKLAHLRKNILFEYVDVPGHHHFHLNEPEKVNGRLSQFLIKYRSDAEKKSKL